MSFTGGNTNLQGQEKRGYHPHVIPWRGEPRPTTLFGFRRARPPPSLPFYRASLKKSRQWGNTQDAEQQAVGFGVPMVYRSCLEMPAVHGMLKISTPVMKKAPVPWEPELGCSLFPRRRKPQPQLTHSAGNQE